MKESFAETSIEVSGFDGERCDATVQLSGNPSNQQKSSSHGHVLDRNAELHVDEAMRPHWMQDGAITFITIRLADSIPAEVLIRWDRERLEYLARFDIRCEDWRMGVERLTNDEKAIFVKQFRRFKEIELDKCHGSSPLRDPELAKIVADAFLHFNGDRYFMGDFIVMPNHAHCLAIFPDSTVMRKQCYSWTHYTAVKIHRILGQKGDFWQEEPFDHLVRSSEQLKYLRQYIADNPKKAGLSKDEYLYRRSERIY